MMLAMAERTDLSMGAWGFVLFCAAVLLVVGGMGFVAVRMARGSKWAEVILPVAILWAVLLAWSLIRVGTAERKYEKEKMVAIQSGYYDKSAWTGTRWPWGVWMGLGAGYAGMLVLGRSGRRTNDKVTR